MAAETALAPFLLEAAAWLVTYALHSTAILVAALVAFAIIARAARRSPIFADAAPAWRERIGKVALLAGIATASVQTALGIEPFGVRPALLEVADAAAIEPAREPRFAEPTGRTVEATPALAALDQVPAAQPLATVPLYLVPVVGALRQAARLSQPAPEIEPVAAPDPALDAHSDPRSGWILAFVALWAVVAVAAFARRFVGWRALSASLAGAEPVADVGALARFDALCHRAGLRRTGPRAARLCVAPLLASPVTRGIAAPQICIPPRALRDLDEDEFAALLGHEIAHAARRDPAWLAVFRLLEVVFCLQPLNRVVARRLEDDAELLCDDRAVVWTGDRLPLASCLTEVASWLVAGGREPRLAVGMAAHGARLSRRVERLVDDGHRPDAGARRPLLTAGAVAFAASAIAVVPGLAAQRRARPLSSEGGADLEVPATLVPAPLGAAEVAMDPDAGIADAECADCTVPAVDGDVPTAPGAPASTAPVSADAMPLAGVLDELRREIAALRDSLRQHDGGDALASDLDVLERRVDELRARETALTSALEPLLARPAHILLSPDVSGRSAEDQ